MLCQGGELDDLSKRGAGFLKINNPVMGKDMTEIIQKK